MSTKDQIKESQDNLGDYSAKNITILENIEAIRHRPEMYIGGTNLDAYLRLVLEIIFNSVDEYSTGFGNEIDVEIKDDYMSIRDYGRGIPVDIHPKLQKPVLEVLVTTIHSGGKFGSKESYKYSSGLHGVGMVVVNALSEIFKVEVFKGNQIYIQNFVKGIKSSELLTLSNTDNEKNGTKVSFKVDNSIFEENKFNNEYFEIFLNKIKDITCINPGLLFNLKVNDKVYKIGNIISSFKDFLIYKSKDSIDTTNVFYYEGEFENIKVDLGFGILKQGKRDIIYSFVNNITTIGGTHINTLRSNFVKFFNQKAIDLKFLKLTEEGINSDDLKATLAFAFKISLPDPRFDSQTKERLTNNLSNEFQHLFYGALEKLFFEKRDLFNLILEKLLEKRHARLTKNVVHISKDFSTSRLIDCISTNPDECILFTVEGLSAGGNTKLGRDPQHQAVFTLRGKPLNVEKISDVDKIFNNEEIALLYKIINYDVKDEKLNYEKLKYSKIVILADADADGHHINLLLLTFFYKFMRNLIINKHVYVVQAPLYCLRKSSSGEIFDYFYTQSDYDNFTKNNKSKNYYITRLKGLGEMNWEQLRDTALSPIHSRLVEVEIDDINNIAITDKIISELMGNEVEKRKDFVLKELFDTLDLV